MIVNNIISLNESIECVFKQSIDFEDIEIIFIDEVNIIDSKKVCFKYLNDYPNNIIYLSKNEFDSSVYNHAINISKGKYLKFLVSGDKLDFRACKYVYDFFEENKSVIDIISIHIKSVSEYTDNCLFQNLDCIKICNLTNEPTVPISFFSLFFKSENIKNIKFNPKLLLNDDLGFSSELIADNPLIGISHDLYYYKLQKNHFDSLDIDYHINQFKIYCDELIPCFRLKYGLIFDFMKCAILHKIQTVFNHNPVKDIFSGNKLELLKNHIYKLLQVIDDEYILNSNCGDKNLKYTLLIFKYGGITTERITAGNVEKLVNGNVIDGLNFHFLYVDSLEIHNNTLFILGFLRSYFNFPKIQIQSVKFNKQDFLIKWENYFNKYKLLFFKNEFLNDDGASLKKTIFNSLECTFNFENDNINPYCSNYIKKDKLNNYLNSLIEIDEWFSIDKISNVFLKSEFFNLTAYNNIYEFFLEDYIENNALIFDAIKVDYKYRERKYLDLNFISFFNYEMTLPLLDFEDSIIKLRVKYDSMKFYLNITFQNYSKLSKESFYSLKDQYIIKFKNNSFEIFNYSLDKLLMLEKENINYLMSNEDLTLFDIVKFRKCYYYSFFKYFGKTIWLFMDRLDSADDNAEHLYNYAIHQDDGIEKYFIISEESKDYLRLKTWANVIIAGSEEHKLLFCHADKIISSQVDDEFLNPFHGDNERFYSGLFSPKIYFLQHGVTLHDVSSWLHKYDKYLYLITTLSKFEYDSFFNSSSSYNYDKSVIQLLGFPRFDNLKKLDDKKEIVIMPTWRRHLHNFDENDFKSSMFFKVYNSLLNNKKLISFLNKNNYKLIFKPHHNLEKYLCLFDKSPSVEFDVDRSYNDIFNHSSLIITDFSSVVFDFAYLKKPVIYYHFKDIYHFDIDNSYFDYNSMGFGEIVDNEGDLINLIQEYVKSNCEMKNMYINRVEDFFEFNDTNNCKRVYEFILNN